MKRIAVLLLLLAPTIWAQNTVTVTAANIRNGLTPLSAGTILFQAQNANGQNISYQIGGTGPNLTAPTVCAITNGAITGPACTLPNVAVSVPQNFCFNVTIKSSTNVVVLGGPGSGYQCVQPTINSNWCALGTCDVDNFAPWLATSVVLFNLPPPGATTLGGITDQQCPATPSQQVVAGYSNVGQPNCVTVSGGPGGNAVWGQITGTLANQLDLSAALALLAPLNSPTLSGAPTVPTAPTNDSSALIANTSWVQGQAYAPLASPAFTGTPTAPTVATNDSSTKLATTAWVNQQGFGVGTGNVTGPSSSTLNDFTCFGGTNGKSIVDCGFGYPIPRAQLGVLAAGSNGLAASATTDTTNASNISSGTLSGALLPNPTTAVLGGVKSYTASAHQFLTGISNTGIPTAAQPACADLSNASPSCSTDATNASNISSGTIGSAYLPNPLFPTGTQLLNVGTSALPGIAFAGAPAVGLALTLNPAAWTVTAATGTGTTVTVTLSNTSGWTFSSGHFKVGSAINSAGIGTGYNCTICVITAVNAGASTISFAGTGTSPLSGGTVQLYDVAWSAAASEVQFNSLISSSSTGCPQNGSIKLCGGDAITGNTNSLNYTSTLLQKNVNAAAGDLRAAQIGDTTYGAVTAVGAPLVVNGNLTVTGTCTGCSSAPVTSVFGRTGAITATSGDYTVSQVTGAAPLASPTFTGTVTIPAGASIAGYLTTALAATTYAPLASPTFTGTSTIPTASINSLTITGSCTGCPVASVFGRTGAVTANSGDYTVGQVTGAAPLASPTFTGTVTLPATVVSSTVVQNNRANTYIAGYPQTFAVNSGLSDLVIGTLAGDICCSAAAGSTWINTAGLNGNAHQDWFDGNFYWANLTNGDNPCNMANGCSGTGATALVNSPVFTTPNIGNAVGTSLTLSTTTGDQMDLQSGTGKIVTGALTSGTFATSEVVIQGTSGASATFLAIEPSGNMLLNGVTGTPDSSHTWVGQTSSAVFTPTATPGTPYLQNIPASGHIRAGYSSGNCYAMTENGDPYLCVTRTVAAGSATMSVVAIAAGACQSSPTTVASANVLNTDHLEFWNATLPGANPGVLTIRGSVTAGNVNFEYCNPTAGSITPSASTLNWSVTR